MSETEDSVEGEYNSSTGRFFRRDDASGNIEVMFGGENKIHIVRLTPEEAQELGDLLHF